MALQLVPPLVLASQVIVPLPLPDKVIVPFDPLHTDEDAVLKAVEAGACNTLILTWLLLTGEQTPKASLTTARYHLSPTTLVALIEVVVTAREVHVV